MHWCYYSYSWLLINPLTLGLYHFYFVINESKGASPLWKWGSWGYAGEHEEKNKWNNLFNFVSKSRFLKYYYKGVLLWLFNKTVQYVL